MSKRKAWQALQNHAPELVDMVKCYGKGITAVEVNTPDGWVTWNKSADERADELRQTIGVTPGVW